MIRQTLAGLLRWTATRLDKRTYIRDRWHAVSVEAMNKYIGDTERYILALENLVPNTVLDHLRQANGRHDRRRLVNGGSWGGPVDQYTVEPDSDPSVN